jgi:hypothetical protein
MAQPERERADRARLERDERRTDDGGVLREEEEDLLRFGLGEEGGVDGGGTLGGGREDEVRGVLALDRGQTDVGVLKVRSCGRNGVSG